MYFLWITKGTLSVLYLLWISEKVDKIFMELVKSEEHDFLVTIINDQLLLLHHFIYCRYVIRS